MIAREGIEVLNVAGSRESNAPGSQTLTRAVLVETFRIGRCRVRGRAGGRGPQTLELELR